MLALVVSVAAESLTDLGQPIAKSIVVMAMVIMMVVVVVMMIVMTVMMLRLTN